MASTLVSCFQTLRAILEDFMAVDFLDVKAAGPPEICRLSLPASLFPMMQMGSTDIDIFFRDALLNFLKNVWSQQLEAMQVIT